MADLSDWIQAKAGMPAEPVPVSQLKNEPETIRALAAETLEEYLMDLYLDQ